jgi:ABC-type antimicrobial peptide transport system permease subunit
LYVAVLIIFIVALVIINNAMLMATLERVQEIGTLRAIGTQRSFIRRMLLVETLVVGALFGGVGAAVGAGIVKLIGSVGIPATSDQLYFFFSGPRLYPALGTTTLVAALVITMLVSALSAFYPAWIGMRVSPLQAMQTDE